MPAGRQSSALRTRLSKFTWACGVRNSIMKTPMWNTARLSTPAAGLSIVLMNAIEDLCGNSWRVAIDFMEDLSGCLRLCEGVAVIVLAMRTMKLTARTSIHSPALGRIGEQSSATTRDNYWQRAQVGPVRRLLQTDRSGVDCFQREWPRASITAGCHFGCNRRHCRCSRQLRSIRFGLEISAIIRQGHPLRRSPACYFGFMIRETWSMTGLGVAARSLMRAAMSSPEIGLSS